MPPVAAVGRAVVSAVRVNRFRRRALGIGLLSVLIVVLLGGFGAVATAASLEYKVKAAYLYNLLLFVRWPESGSSDDLRSPVRVCLLGRDPFGDAIDPIVQRKVGKRPIALLRLADHRDTSGCHLVFVGSSEKARLSRLLRALRDNNVLSVGDMEGFARRGGMVGLVLKGGKVRLEINRTAAREAGLRLSAKLLEVASAVYD
jgi:hypothetical protein